MKRLIYIIQLSVILLAAGCTNLDKFPLDEVSHETFWKTEEQLRSALYPCYEGLQYDFIINLNACGDDLVWGDLSSGLSKISGGRHSDMDGFPFTSYWRYAYAHIFNCNNFLGHYNAAAIPQEKKDIYAAEVKVIRAFQYYYMTTLWGDVPLITRVITASDPEAYGPRTPRAEVIKFIMDDLDWAASKLGEEIQTGKNLGRINKWGALALKARIALQNEMWDEAAVAAKFIIDNGPYELYPNYGELFQKEGEISVNPNNKETIITSLYKEDVRTHNLTHFTCAPIDYIRLNASKRLVDAFLCTDGKPAKAGLEYYGNTSITTSGLYTYPETHYADYYKNRDPRLAMTLYCPGEAWPGGDDGDTDVNVVNETFNLPRFAVLQSNNRLGANSYTGFYFKKYNTPERVGMANKDYSSINVIRYAEILLIYAEALFEKQGKKLTQDQIDETINELRDRAGMHRMKLDELNTWGLNLEVELHRERRVEMSFCGTRYFDILRWKEGDKLAFPTVGPSLTVCINDLGKTPYPDRVDEFNDIVYENNKRFDASKHYLWPVPYEERVKNPNLGQNPGWSK